MASSGKFPSSNDQADLRRSPPTELHQTSQGQSEQHHYASVRWIENPLYNVPRHRLFQQVQEFAEKKDLQDLIPILRKGALVASDPEAYRAFRGDKEGELNAEDVAMLEKEMVNKWHQSKSLWYTIIVCSIGAAVQGWDQTGSNGANLGFPTVFGIETNPNIGARPNSHDWTVGFINSAPYLSAALCGCWLADPLNNLFGRRGTILLAGIFCFFPVIGSAFSQSWQQLLVCRLLLGLGMGTKSTTVPIFAAECAPARIRGTIVMSWQLYTAAGIFFGFSANLAVFHLQNAWRYQLGSALIPAIPLVIGIYFCAESPRLYIKRGEYRKAYNSLCRLRVTELQAARDFYYMHAQMQEEQEYIDRRRYSLARSTRKSKIGQRFMELFTVPRIRRATLASFVVMLAQQLCGINIVAFYSTTIFKQVRPNDFDQKKAFWASWGFGLINFLFALPAVRSIDEFGRRSLLLFTFPHMAWTLIAAGLSFKAPVGSNLQLGLVVAFVYLFAMFYSPGEGPVPYPYSAEVFPLSHREIGMAWAVATTNFWASVLSLTFPSMLHSFKETGSFCFYAGLNVFALVIIFLFVPETKRRTLEELDQIFSISTRVFMQSQLRGFLPWLIKRYVLFNKDAKNFTADYFDVLRYHRDQTKRSPEQTANGNANGSTEQAAYEDAKIGVVHLD